MTIKVNGAIIPEEAIKYELDRLVKFYSEYVSPDEILKQMDALKVRAKDQAIGAKLLISEAARLDIPVPPANIDKRLAQLIKDAGGKEKFDRMLVDRGMTEDSIRKTIEQGCKVDLLVEKVTQSASDPTEAEMQEHFKTHSKEYHKQERVLARHLLVLFDPANPADKETARSRIMEIRRKIEEGADFAGQAAAHSDCPSGKKTGGSLGWIGRGMTIPEFDQAVFSMKVGELSQVVETPLGFHIIHKIDHEDAALVEFDDVREKIREFLRHSQRGGALSAYVNELKQKAVIEEV